MKPVELHDIRPGRKEGISPQGQDLAAYLEKFARLLRQIIGTALNEIIWMLRDPGMIRSHVIGDKIEDQSYATLGQFLSRCSKSRRPSQVLIHDVAPHAIGRADIVLRGKISESPAEIRKQTVVLHRDGETGRAALPHTHEPDGIEAVRGYGLPFLIGNRGKVTGLRCVRLNSLSQTQVLIS